MNSIIEIEIANFNEKMNLIELTEKSSFKIDKSLKL